MRKSIIHEGGSGTAAAGDEWLDLERDATVEVTSEEDGHPVEFALVVGRASGWRASGPGTQTIRLRFNEPRHIRRVRVRFAVPLAARTQEFAIRAVSDGLQRDVVRQQWTFSPGGSTEEAEDYWVDLPGVTVLELTITPNISGGDARASLAEMRVG